MLRFVAARLPVFAATFFAAELAFVGVVPIAVARRRFAADMVPASRNAARIADVQDFSARAPVRRRGMQRPSGDGLLPPLHSMTAERDAGVNRMRRVADATHS
jgi:hypothetical protein